MTRPAVATHTPGPRPSTPEELWIGRALGPCEPAPNYKVDRIEEKIDRVGTQIASLERAVQALIAKAESR